MPRHRFCAPGCIPLLPFRLLFLYRYYEYSTKGDIVDILVNSFRGVAESLLESVPEILMAIVALVIAHFAGRGLRKVYQRIIKKSSLDGTYRTFFGKLIYGLILVIGFLAALNILGFYGLATSILASGGITAIILGFAFRDIGENFLAGFFMAFSRPFRTGDLIETEGISGRVQNIEMRHTHIRTADGCDVFVPSAQLLSSPLFNYTRDGLRRGSFSVGIDYGDDAEGACRLLSDRIHSERKVVSDPAPSVQISGFNPLFVELTVYFWIEVDVSKQEIYLAEIKSKLMDACRLTLAENGYTFSSGVSSAVEMKELNVNLRGDVSSS